MVCRHIKNENSMNLNPTYTYKNILQPKFKPTIMDQILKDFGFQIEEKSETKLPPTITLIIKSGQHYTFKTKIITQISVFISNLLESACDSKAIDLPEAINDKFMGFLIDYADFIEENKGIPIYSIKKIESATPLENAVGMRLHGLFEKHFNYKFVRSDIAVKQYLSIFGYFLKCSTVIISEPLITLFAIAHKIILQHLPSSEFIIVED